MLNPDECIDFAAAKVAADPKSLHHLRTVALQSAIKTVTGDHIADSPAPSEEEAARRAQLVLMTAATYLRWLLDGRETNR